jgi:hypothetical protein
MAESPLHVERCSSRLIEQAELTGLYCVGEYETGDEPVVVFELFL